jgi:hypothetical protein
MNRWFTLSLLIFGAANLAHADTYHRFWRGMKSSNLNWAQFETGLNQVFIPATVQTGSGKGMIGYEPVLFEGSHGLPDEIALVSYSDKATYDSLYSTAAGKAYQNLHWSYFDQSSSHSLVPQPYVGAVDLEQAYDLVPSYDEWMKNTTTVAVFFRAPQEVSTDYLKRAQEHIDHDLASDAQNGVFDRVILISGNYWIEYESASSALGSDSGADLLIPIQNEAPDDAQITPGAGIDLVF